MKANVDRYEFAKVRMNLDPLRLTTHGGAVGAYETTTEKQLFKQVVTCLLFEDHFYAKGAQIASSIAELVSTADPKFVANLAVQARNEFHLRHVPMFLLALLDKRRKEVPGLVKATLPQIIQRADELAEFLAIHSRVYEYSMKDLKKHLGAQVKRGLAAAFPKFSAYGLAKYNRDESVQLRDVLFLSHPKPKDDEQQKVWEKLINDALESPDTWEVALSAGANKKETFERLLKEKKLGGMALLRNLRLMKDEGVDIALVKDALAKMKFDRVLPFRFLSAAAQAPHLTNELSDAMVRALTNSNVRLPGRTLLVIDVSGSMQSAVSAKSDLNRVNASAALAMLVREVCDEVVIYATAGSDSRRGHKTARVADDVHGFKMADAIDKQMHTLGGGGIFFVQCMKFIEGDLPDPKFDRVIVFTDEQDCDDRGRDGAAARKAPLLGKYNYIQNVASYDVGFDIGDRWTRVSGFSERMIDFVALNEKGALELQTA